MEEGYPVSVRTRTSTAPFVIGDFNAPNRLPGQPAETTAAQLHVLGQPAVLGRTQDGRAVISLPLAMDTEAGGKPYFPDTYSMTLEGHLPREVYNAIRARLNQEAGVHYMGHWCMWGLSVVTCTLACVCLMPYEEWLTRKRNDLLEQAMAELNAQYNPHGINLRRNASPLGMSRWQADLEVLVRQPGSPCDGPAEPPAAVGTEPVPKVAL